MTKTPFLGTWGESAAIEKILLLLLHPVALYLNGLSQPGELERLHDRQEGHTSGFASIPNLVR